MDRRHVVVQWLLLAWVALACAGCNSQEAVTLVALNVSGLTAAQQSVVVTAQLDGMAAVPATETFTLGTPHAATETLGLRLAPSLYGTLTLNVVAQATDPSQNGTGEAQATLAGQSSIEVGVQLSISCNCPIPSCANGVQTTAGTCNGNGQCSEGTKMSCAPYVCGQTACKTSCTQDSDCAEGTCNVCPSVAKLCLAPLGVGDCQDNPCHPADPATCGPLGTFPVGSYPVRIAFDGTNMWVTNYASNNVTKLSPTGVILGTFPAGITPYGIAFDGTNMWVVGFNGGVTELSPTGAILGNFATGSGPIDIAFDGTNMWVTNQISNNVTKLSPTGATLGTFTVGTYPNGIAFDGMNMWVVNQNSNNVTKLSLTGETLNTFPVGTAPVGIAFDGTNMWVTIGGDNTVTKLSPTGATLGTYSISGTGSIAFDGTNMWVVVSNSVTKLSPTGTTLGTFAVPSNAHGIAFDGTHMWVVNTSDSNVIKL